jgi:hypothetical protein
VDQVSGQVILWEVVVAVQLHIIIILAAIHQVPATLPLLAAVAGVPLQVDGGAAVPPPLLLLVEEVVTRARDLAEQRSVNKTANIIYLSTWASSIV